jgi:hypothetical protein
MSHQAPIARRPAVKPALVTRAQRALCTVLVAATFAACSPPVAPRPAASPLAAPPTRYAVATPDLTRGVGGGQTMGFYISACLYQPPSATCLNLVFGLGAITARTPHDFEVFSQTLDRVLPHGLAGSGTGKWAVVLDSEGGNVVAALELGHQFREHNWNTVVGLDYPLAGQWRIATCASACVYAFAGGPQRFVFKDNVLGVHQFTDGAKLRMNVAQAQYLTASISAYLIQMGVSANVQALAGLTPANGVTPLMMQDAIALGLATHRS